MKLLKKLLFFAAILQATLLLIACGDSKVSGTDEQTNSVTAAIDSALTEWLSSDTLIAPKQQDTSVHWFSYIIEDPNSTIRNPGIEVKNGTLYNALRDDFKSLTCETETNWFVYSVNASDSLIRKYLVLPDTMSADNFESDCIAEGGEFATDTTSETAGQLIHSCNLETAEHLSESRHYVDPNWKKYVELIVGICRK
ncbi:MAG: hypothetical protein II892_13500 [Fibrobacter sp.]|nr:hypothetical protein [Fibrobacter sp.]